MSTMNDKLFRNHPVWDGNTSSARMDVTGGGSRDQITGAGNPGLSGTYIIISNQTGQVLSVHAGDTVAAVLVPTSGTFETAIGAKADIWLSVAGGGVSNGAHIFYFH